MGKRGVDRRLRQRLFRGIRRSERGDRHRVPRLLARQSVVDPQLLRSGAHQRARGAPAAREELAQFLCLVQECSLRFDGSAYRTMLRNDAYWFSRLGVFIERADNTARILDVKYHLLLPAEQHVGGPLDYFQWAAILRSVSALTAYHWVYRESLKPWLIADLL